MEKVSDQTLQMADDIHILFAHAETQSFGVQGTVTHEVADQFSQLRRHGSGDTGLVVSRPVQFSEGRQQHCPRFADQTH